MAGTLGRGMGRREPISAINVTPLVDVVLVLLIILMVTSTYVVAQMLRVQLPKTRASDGIADKPATVVIEKTGALRYDDQPITEAALAEVLHARTVSDPDTALVVSADEVVPHGRVVRVLDVAKVAGITRFAINVQSE